MCDCAMVSESPSRHDTCTHTHGRRICTCIPYSRVTWSGDALSIDPTIGLGAFGSLLFWHNGIVEWWSCWCSECLCDCAMVAKSPNTIRVHTEPTYPYTHYTVGLPGRAMLFPSIQQLGLVHSDHCCSDTIALWSGGHGRIVTGIVGLFMSPRALPCA